MAAILISSTSADISGRLIVGLTWMGLVRLLGLVELT